MNKRIFLIVLDSLGIGALPDAADYGDEGSHTLRSVLSTGVSLPNLEALGLFSVEGAVKKPPEKPAAGVYARMGEKSKGKDSTIGHWELAGIFSKAPLPTYPHGFPCDLLEQLSQETGRPILCNQPYSGTQVIADFGREQMQSGGLIVYTSADSVLQIAAHQDVVPVEELYACCRAARKIFQGRHGVGRVIARPFAGEYPHFYRTPYRHDFSLEPPGKTFLDVLSENGKDVLAVGKIFDLFAGRGVTESFPTSGNTEGILRTKELLARPFDGLCFVNLVDFDMLYGHRNDPEGYAKALLKFDSAIPDFLEQLEPEDLLMITADHGCDPLTPSTDHSREYVPWLIVGESVGKNINLGTLPTFADVSATILDAFGLPLLPLGTSRLKEILAPCSKTKTGC